MSPLEAAPRAGGGTITIGGVAGLSHIYIYYTYIHTYIHT